MGTGVYFLVEALFYVLLLMIVYFSKKRLKMTENKVYSLLIIVALGELLLELLLDFVGPLHNEIVIISYFVAKLYCVFLQLWLTLLCMYIVIVALKMKEKNKYIKRIIVCFISLACIFTVSIFLLPIDFYYNNFVAYTYGPAVNIVYFVSFIYVIIGITFLIWNRKNIKDKRYYPLLLFLILGGIGAYIQYLNPNILLAIPIHAFLTFLMYFTIENPDMKMLEEVYKSKKIADKVNEDKSNFLFSVTNEIRKSINEVDSICNYTSELEDIKEVKKTMQGLKYVVNNAKNRLNSTININTMDMKNIKVINSKYNLKTIIKEIEINLREKQKENVEVKFNISETIPNKLYGDSVKIKQILITLLLNSLKYTKKGYVETEIKAIKKNDICRLIINITDTGQGIELKQINEILDNKEELSEKDYNIYNGKDLNLKLINKIVQIMGGTIIINSDINEGTRISIMIDQKIAEEKEERNLEEYANNMYNKKKVLVVITEEKEKKKLEKVLNKIDANIEYTESSKYLLDQVREKEKYDLFILEEEIKKINGHELLEKLKKEGNNIPIILYSKEEDSMENKKLYLKEGFSDVIFDIDKNSLIDTIDKYLTKE